MYVCYVCIIIHVNDIICCCVVQYLHFTCMHAYIHALHAYIHTYIHTSHVAHPLYSFPFFIAL